MKLVINTCFGGFGLSHAAVMEYARLSGFAIFAWVTDRESRKSVPYDPTTMGQRRFVNYTRKPLKANGELDQDGYFSVYDLKRDDPVLIAVVESLGEAANGDCAKLKIVEVPDGVQWELSEYDGIESVEEQHRSWN